MQKAKTVMFGDRSFTVKELSTRIIWDLVNSTDKKDDVMTYMKNMLVMGCPELTTDTFLDLYPSEIEVLWAAFEEVNAAFLGLLRRVGLDQVIITAMKKTATTLTGQFVLSSSQAMARLHGTTGIHSSLQH